MSDSIKSSISGYGLVFKRVMKDTNLNIEAKALYSYLSAYAGADESAFPSVKLICHELSISEKRLQKYRKQLVDYGYLKIERTKSNNIYGKNLYTINHEPRPVHFGGVENGGIQIGSVKTRPVENVGTTNNNPTINSITNNSITNNNETSNSSSAQPSPFDFYQENGFGMLKPYVAEQISDWIDDFKDNGNEIVIEAMKEAVNNNVTNWSYVNSILNAWDNDGVKTTEDIQARNKKRSNKNNGLQGQDMLDAMQDPSYWD